MQDGHLHVSQRLLAGACAGMSATLVTHPLDVVRLRLSLPQAGYTGKPDDPSVSSASVKLMNIAQRGRTGLSMSHIHAVRLHCPHRAIAF